MQTLNEALSRKTVPEVKALAALLPTPARGSTKAAVVAGIEAGLAGPLLPGLWEGLDPLQRLAVAECLYAADGRFDSRKFIARHGALPQFNQGPGGARRYASGDEKPTRLRLFLYEEVGYRSVRMAVPQDLRAGLLEFVPKPAEPRLAETESLPEQVDGQLLVVRSTESEASADLALLLRLADQGRLQVSDKTAMPGHGTLALLAEKLSGGDFYTPDATLPRFIAQPGPIKAVAWPLLLQAAGLVLRGAGKSALSPAGRKALGSSPAEVLRTIWQKWLKSGVLDEFSRVDLIKGQKSKGPVMTAVAPRRAAIALALQQCPVGAWVAVDELARYMQAADLDFEVAHDAWKLYLSESRYGSLGYDGSNGWPILQLRYLMCFLFEYAAVLGIVDVAYVEPQHAHQNFRSLWGADDLAFLSRYDGLLQVRLTPLGAFCLGLTPQHSPALVQARAALSVLPSLTVQVVAGALAAEEAAVLETWASPVSESAWLLDRQKAVAAVERGISTQELELFLRSRDAQPLPPTVEAFLRDSQAMGQALCVLGPAVLIECSDAQIASRIAHHAETSALCVLAGERRLVVRTEKLDRFRAKVRVLGFGMPA